MDKTSKGNKKVIVKINGERESTEDQLIIHNWQTKKETAVARRKEFLENAKIVKKKPNNRKRLMSRFHPFHSNKQQLSFVKFSITVLSAVVIGLSFGFFLLHAIDKDVNEGIGEKETTTHPVTAGYEQMVLPGKELLFLQQGAYQSEESVQQLVNQYKERQLPAIYIDDGEYYRVFVAVVSDEDAAERLMDMSFFQNQYGETWPKKMEMEEKIFRNLTGDEKQFLQSAYSVFTRLVEEGTKIMVQGEKYVGNLDAVGQDIENIRSLTNIEQQPIVELYESLLNSYEQFVRFSKTREMEDWQKGQAELLQFAVHFYLL